MTQISAKAVKTLLAGLFAVVGLVGFQAGAVASAPSAPQVPAPAAAQPLAAQPLAAQPLAAQPLAAQPLAAQSLAAQPPCGDTSQFEQVNLSQLPPEAADTVELVKKGGPYPYPQDGQVFDNREGILPECQKGYYKEYTVETPGSDDRGARRFVVGDGGEYFYTEDHYDSFKLTLVDA